MKWRETERVKPVYPHRYFGHWTATLPIRRLQRLRALVSRLKFKGELPEQHPSQHTFI